MKSRLFEYLLNTPNLPVRQPDLYSMRMIRRICQQVFNRADGLLARSLILFQNDRDLYSGRYVFALAVRH